MKTTITFAVACLLAPADAIKLKTLFPEIPPLGKDITEGISEALKEGERELPKLMYQKEKWCNTDQEWYNPEYEEPYCDEWESGLRRDLQRLNRDVVEVMDQKGIDFNANTYDPKFITDLIEYEYRDFVKLFNENKGDLAREIDSGLKEFTKEATRAGFAQVSQNATATAEPARWQPDPNDCNALWNWDQKGGNECPQVPEDQMECPGPCCWRGPNDDAEALEFDKYYFNEWKQQRAAVEECMLQSKWVQQELREFPNEEQFVDIVNQVISGVVGEAQNTRNVEELARAIDEINHTLSSEASRLGMEAPKLPEPKDTAEKLAKFVVAIGEDSKSPNAQFEIVREHDRLYWDVVSGTWETEQSINRMLPPGTSLDDPVGIVDAVTDGLKAGEADRDLKYLARDLGDLGIQTSGDEIKEIALSGLGALRQEISNGDVEREVHVLEEEAMHLEEEVAQELHIE